MEASSAFDFMEKIPLVKPPAFQVTLDQAAKNNPKAKQPSQSSSSITV